MDAITARANALIGAITAQRNDALNRCAELTADLLASRAQTDEMAQAVTERDRRIADLERVTAAMVAAQTDTEIEVPVGIDELQPGAVDLGGLED